MNSCGIENKYIKKNIIQATKLDFSQILLSNKRFIFLNGHVLF